MVVTPDSPERFKRLTRFKSFRPARNSKFCFPKRVAVAPCLLFATADHEHALVPTVGGAPSAFTRYNWEAVADCSAVHVSRHNDEVTCAARAGRPLPKLYPSADLKGASGVLSTLKHSSGKTFGTNEERTEMKRRVYAYYHTFGRPHLMVTASPRDENSFWIAVHAGFDASTPEAAAKSFDDLWGQDKPFPHQDDIKRAALRDPTLVAIQFDDFTTFFFEKVVGWDKTAGKAIDGGGLFGKAVAYTAGVAGVETQGQNTTFEDCRYHGVKSRRPSAPVECIYVRVTNVRLKVRAPNQPTELPANVICLPRTTVFVQNSVTLPANVSTRKSVSLKVRDTSSLRPFPSQFTFRCHAGQKMSQVSHSGGTSIDPSQKRRARTTPSPQRWISFKAFTRPRKAGSKERNLFLRSTLPPKSRTRPQQRNGRAAIQTPVTCSESEGDEDIDMGA